MSPFILYSDGEGNIFEDNSLYACGRSGWDALPVDESTGSSCRRAVLCMNFPAGGVSASTWKPVKCVFVKKAGPLQHLFRRLIPGFISLPMKPAQCAYPPLILLYSRRMVQ